MSDLSLFDIERGLHELMGVWQEAETPEAVAAAEEALAQYAANEVRKVDNIRKYLSLTESMIAAAKAEASVQTKRAQSWTARRDRLKAFVYDAMKAFGTKKLEGNTGSFSIRGNGGLQTLTITDASLLEDALCDVTVTMTAKQWRSVVICQRADCASIDDMWSITQFGARREPSHARIRAALSAGPVAGARLEERGESLIVK